MIDGWPDHIYEVYLVAGRVLTDRMLQARVSLPRWFRQPQPAYANETPEQLVRAGRTEIVVQMLNEQRNNG